MDARTHRVDGLAPRLHYLHTAAAVVGGFLAVTMLAAAAAAASTDAAVGGRSIAELVRPSDPASEGPSGTRDALPFCDGPISTTATCPCYFKASFFTEESVRSFDMVLALAPTQPPGTTAAVREAATRELAAATIKDGKFVEDDPNSSFKYFNIPETVLREAVTVTATVTLVGGNSTASGANCTSRLELFLLPVEETCPPRDISVGGQGAVVGPPAAPPSALQPRIVGGAPLTDPAARGWVVGLYADSGDGEFSPVCTGFLIGVRHLLTAAHCPVPPGSIAAFLPRTAGGSGGVNVTIVAEIGHPDHNSPEYANDIKVLRLAADAPTWPTAANAVPPTILNRNSSLPIRGSGVRSAGYGMINQEFPVIGGWKARWVDTRVISQAACKAGLEATGPPDGQSLAAAIDSRVMICAGVPAGGCSVCYGDSGGALYQTVSVDDGAGGTVSTSLMVGVTSFGSGCAQKDVQAVYTRVSAFTEWIDEVMG